MICISSSVFPVSRVNVPGGTKYVATAHLPQEHTVLYDGHPADRCTQKFVSSSNDVAIWRQGLDVPRHVILDRTERKRHVVIGLIDDNSKTILFGYHADQLFLFIQNGRAGDLARNNRIDHFIDALVRMERHQVMRLYHVLDDGFVFRFSGIPFVPSLKMGLEIHAGTGLGVEG